jgi:transcriptional regulator GlxA family with amidase domain
MQKTLFKGVTQFVPIAPVLIRDTSIYELFLDVCSALLDPEMLLLEKEERLERFVRVLFREYSAWDDLCLRTDQINTDPRIQQAQQYMRENLHRDLSVSEIAHHVGISPFYFTRSFRNSVGIPPHAYHLNLRIDRAKELLSTDMPIAQIALEVGFSDQSHLNRVFKKITACTPYEYTRGKVE